MTIYNEGWDLNILKRLLQSKKDKTKQQPRKIEAPFGKGLETLSDHIHFYNGGNVTKTPLAAYGEWQSELEARHRALADSFKLAPPFPTEWTVEYHPHAPKQKTPKVKKPKLGKWDVKLE